MVASLLPRLPLDLRLREGRHDLGVLGVLIVQVREVVVVRLRRLERLSLGLRHTGLFRLGRLVALGLVELHRTRHPHQAGQQDEPDVLHDGETEKVRVQRVGQRKAKTSPSHAS